MYHSKGGEIVTDTNKNSNFVMMYREHMPEIRWLMKKSGIASSILNFIMEHMNSQNALVCSQKVFMEYFEISRPTVARAIKLLYECGFIDIMKSGTANVYIVAPNVAWTSWNNQREYCKFDGKILIAKSENKDSYYRTHFDRLKALREKENLK